MLTLQYLRAVETMLRARYGRPDFRLHEYFDLIGGTSTGAIIAAGLALGRSVDEIECLYRDLATRIFTKPWYSIGAFTPKFGHASLVRALQDAFGAGTTLGSDRLKTGLLVIAKRMDSGSPWVVTNSQRDPYFFPTAGQKRVGNCNMNPSTTANPIAASAGSVQMYRAAIPARSRGHHKAVAARLRNQNVAGISVPAPASSSRSRSSLSRC